MRTGGVASSGNPAASRSNALALAIIRTTVGDALLTPCRSSSSRDGLPEPMTVQLPGTRLGLTGGSAWLRHTTEARRTKGMYLSLQLSY